MDPSHNFSICFVGLDSYPVLSRRKDNSYIGGESVQISLLARAFRELGCRVSVIAGDYGQPDEEWIEGIRVIKAFGGGSGFPVVRFFHRRVYRFMRALAKADAEVYYQSCAAFYTGFVAWFCRHGGKRRSFVFRTAHDTDCMPGRQIVPRAWQRKIYEYGLRKADLIAVQSRKQQELLREHYSLDSEPVNMVVEESGGDLDGTRDIDVLWVNNIRPFKRPELAIELAESLPEYRFVMIGGPCQGLESYYETVTARARRVKNLDFLGFMAYSKVNSYFLRTKIFLNTSESEGFPNSFLQAWTRKVPLVTFFDPDGLVAGRQLGQVAGSLKEMQEMVRGFVSDSAHRREIGDRARQFTLSDYTPVRVAAYYEQLIRKLEQGA